HGLIQRCLLLRERAENLHLILLRQVSDDRAVGLETPQDEGSGKPPEVVDGVGIATRLDRQKVARAECGGSAEIAGVEKVDDGPEIADVVFDRSSGEGDAESGVDGAGGLR